VNDPVGLRHAFRPAGTLVVNEMRVDEERAVLDDGARHREARILVPAASLVKIADAEKNEREGEHLGAATGA
jgi:hypothetical protein